MKHYYHLSQDTLNKISNCFSDDNEITIFINHMELTCEEIKFTQLLRSRVAEEESGAALLRQICVFTLFCREHFDLIQDLVKNLKGKEVTEDELRNMTDH